LTVTFTRRPAASIFSNISQSEQLNVAAHQVRNPRLCSEKDPGSAGLAQALDFDLLPENQLEQ
jgi:hypothetical protein